MKKLLKKLRRIQRRLSKKLKSNKGETTKSSGKNIDKQKLKLQKIYFRISINFLIHLLIYFNYIKLKIKNLKIYISYI